MSRAIPIYQDSTKQYFVDSKVLEPWLDEIETGITVETSALQPHMSIPLLALSETKQLLDAGVMDATDSIDGMGAMIDTIILQLPDGSIVRYPEASQGNKLAAVVFTPKPFNPQEVTCAVKVLVSFNEVAFAMEVNGKLNLQLGELVVYFLPRDNNYKVIGYTIQANRVNLNRRNA